MNATFSYSDRYEPAAPVLPVVASAPGGAGPGVLLRALVDTGADLTVVPTWLASRLGLRTIDAVPVSTPTGSGHATVCAIRLRVADEERIIHALALGDEVLVGRDLLASWIVTLDGPAGRLELSAST